MGLFKGDVFKIPAYILVCNSFTGEAGFTRYFKEKLVDSKVVTSMDDYAEPLNERGLVIEVMVSTGESTSPSTASGRMITLTVTPATTEIPAKKAPAIKSVHQTTFNSSQLQRPTTLELQPRHIATI